GRRFTNAHETLIWFARDRDARHPLNHEAMKALNDDLQMRSDWLLPLCNRPERWRAANGRTIHRTPKPEARLPRALLAATRLGDVVLDPFFGTGTTGAVAQKLGRRWIGIERDPNYARRARERIAAIPPADPTAVDIRARREEPRIPFGWLIERGMIAPGELLFDQRRRYHAKVRADGTLVAAEATGSIHKIAALVQGAPACNGWTFWHVDRGGVAVVIDRLRQELRATLS